MDELEGVFEGPEQSEQVNKLKQRTMWSVSSTWRSELCMLAKRLKTDKGRRKRSYYSPGEKIREEARERMKHDPSLT